MPTGAAIHIGVSLSNPDVWDGSTAATGCSAAAQEMSALTMRLGYASNAVFADERATKPDVTAAIHAVIGTLSAGDILCVSFAGHGFAYEDNNGSHQVVFLLYDQPWNRDEFLRLLTAVDKPLRIVVVALACYGPISPAALKMSEAAIRRRGTPFARVLPFPEARQFWKSSAGWETWARSPIAFTVGSSASVLIVAASKPDELAQGARRGTRLPPFTEALVAGAEQVDNYPQLVTYIKDHTLDSSSTPVLNKSLVRGDDGAFEMTRPFSIR